MGQITKRGFEGLKIAHLETLGVTNNGALSLIEMTERIQVGHSVFFKIIFDTVVTEFRYVHWSAPFFTMCAASLVAQERFSSVPKYLFILSNIALCAYMGFVHQRGQLDLSRHLLSNFCDKNFERIVVLPNIKLVLKNPANGCANIHTSINIDINNINF